MERRMNENPSRSAPRFDLNGARFARGPLPAAAILLVWAALWVWMIVGVVGPLSRSLAPESSGRAAIVDLRA